MKSIKIFLVTVTTLLLVAIFFGVYVWFKLMDLTTSPVDIVVERERGAEVTDQSETDTNALSDSIPPEGIHLTSEALSDSQIRIMQSLGIDVNKITVTKEMVLCIEEMIGSNRLEEIVAGSAPSPLESVKLLQCI